MKTRRVFILLIFLASLFFYQLSKLEAKTKVIHSVYLPLAGKTTNSNGPRYYTIMRSYYVGGGQSLDQFVNLGCAMGNYAYGGVQNDVYLSMLLFGKPHRNDIGQYGALGWDDVFRSPETISNLSAAVAYGFVSCNRDQQDTLLLGVGINSDGDHFHVIASEHGGSWSTMIDQLNERMESHGIDNRVNFSGALNLEPEFSEPTASYNWINNFLSNNISLNIVGAAMDCPTYYPPTEPQSGYYQPANCWVNDWYQSNVLSQNFQLSQNYLRSIPEIYSSNHQAQQWYRIGLLSNLTYYNTIKFTTTTSQEGACQQYPQDASCQPRTNSPQEAHDFLLQEIQSDPYNRVESFLYLATDFKWFTNGIP